MSYLPSIPNGSLLDAFKAQPDLARRIHEFAHLLMRGPSPFTEGERELIAAFVSTLNGCDYCRDSHSSVAERFGISAASIREGIEDIESSSLPRRLKPILRYCRVLNETPDGVEQAHVDEILDEGWGENAVYHAALVCGFFNLMNRWVDGLGIPTNEEVVRLASQMLYEKGYRGVSDYLEKQEVSEGSQDDGKESR